MDDLDKAILAQLGTDARTSVATLARKLKVARLKTIPEVERAYTTSGRVDLLLHVAAASTTILDSVLDQLGALTGVKSSESLIHLSTKIDRAA
jgi:DNA-binding Lrp family transcriptional regulator